MGLLAGWHCGKYGRYAKSYVLHVFFWTAPKVSSSLVIIASVLLGAVVGAWFRSYSIMKSRRAGKLSVLTDGTDTQNRAKAAESDS